MADSEIVMFCHCRQCIGEKPAGLSPLEWADISVGLLADGRLRVWCNRHEREVATYPVGRPH